MRHVYVVWGSGESTLSAIRCADGSDEKDLALAEESGASTIVSGKRQGSSWCVTLDEYGGIEEDLDRDHAVRGYVSRQYRV